jgi:hypothetical protein
MPVNSKALVFSMATIGYKKKRLHKKFGINTPQELSCKKLFHQVLTFHMDLPQNKFQMDLPRRSKSFAHSLQLSK